MVEFYDLAGKKTGSVPLPAPTRSAERQQHLIETVGSPDWGFSYGCPFIVAGNRVYIRSNDELWCVGAK